MQALLRSPMLYPFGVRSFRFQWPADLFVSLAFEMETLILGWYILVESGSVIMLTLYGALLYPGTLLAPLLGAVGDRIGHRAVLCAMRAAYLALAAALLALAATGHLSPLPVIVISALCGLVRPSDLGIRAAIVADTMPPAFLVSAMSASRITSDAARIVGALTGAGVFAVFGMASAYGLICALYAVGLLLTFGIAGQAKKAVAARFAMPPAPWRDLKEGLAYVWTTPHLRGGMILAGLVNLSAFPLSNGLLPYVAKEIYGVGETGLGLLSASFAIGGLIGSLMLSAAATRVRPARLMLVGAGVWYVMLLFYARTHTAQAGFVTLLLAGLAQSLCLVSLSVMLMRTAEEKFRGRVMGVRMLVIYSLPLGLMAAGALVGHIGFAATATVYAGVGLLATLAVAIGWRGALWDMDATANAR